MTLSNGILVALAVCAYVGVVRYLDASPTTIRWWWTRFLIGSAVLYGAVVGGLDFFVMFAAMLYLAERSTPPGTFRLRPYVIEETDARRGPRL